MSELFCIASFLGVARKKNIRFKYCGFSPPPNQNEVKYSHNKCWDKIVFIEMTLKPRKKSKSKEKVELNHLQKMLIYDDFSKKCHVILKKFLLLY